MSAARDVIARESQSGLWLDNHGKEARVFDRPGGGVRVEYRDSWTCCDAATFETWKSYGWKRITVIPSLGGKDA